MGHPARQAGDYDEAHIFRAYAAALASTRNHAYSESEHWHTHLGGIKRVYTRVNAVILQQLSAPYLDVFSSDDSRGELIRHARHQNASSLFHLWVPFVSPLLAGIIEHNYIGEVVRSHLWSIFVARIAAKHLPKCVWEGVLEQCVVCGTPRCRVREFAVNERTETEAIM